MFERGKAPTLKRLVSANDQFDEGIEPKPKKICFDIEMVIDEPNQEAITNYIQTIQLAIEQGDCDRLVSLTKEKRQGIPTLNEIFIKDPGMIKLALDQGMKIDSGKILQVVLDNLTFSKHEEIEKQFDNLTKINLSHVLKNENMTNSPHKENLYYLNNQKKWKEDNLPQLNKDQDSFKKKETKYQQNNHNLIKILFSSYPVCRAKTHEEWALYFKDYPLPYKLGNYLNFEKIKLWKELQNESLGFFQNLGFSIPDDIFIKIAETYQSATYIS